MSPWRPDFYEEKRAFLEQKTESDILIDQIQEIRTRNNKNWMDLVRLAFEVAPERAKEIMRKISEHDSEILELSKQLGETK